MRFINLIKGDLNFAKKYGIILVYIIFTIVYVSIIGYVPEEYKRMMLTILVYTDPAAMGLFFMGAVILLEKSQRVNCSLAVSPVTVKEYVDSKLISLMLLGVVASVAIYVLSGVRFHFLTLVCIGVSSVVFSSCGLIVASHADSLNLFIIESVPFEMVICIPAILYLFGFCKHFLWQLHPGVMAMKVLMNPYDYRFNCIGICFILVWAAIALHFAKREVTVMFCRLGGGKL